MENRITKRSVNQLRSPEPVIALVHAERDIRLFFFFSFLLFNLFFFLLFLILGFPRSKSKGVEE